MAVREFSDTTGTSWRAWNITPDSSPPAREARTAYTDLHDAGWIVFETPDGREKRRLCPYPDQWATMSDAELLQLLVQASTVRRSRLALGHAGPEAEAHPADPNDPDSPALSARLSVAPDASATISGAISVDFRATRSFRYPGGRLWTVRVARVGDEGIQVLRFTAGVRSLDLAQWPSDWATFETDGLVALIRSVARPTAASKEHRGSPSDTTPGAQPSLCRRYSDRIG